MNNDGLARTVREIAALESAREMIPNLASAPAGGDRQRVANEILEKIADVSDMVVGA